MRILCVDDKAENLYLLELTLRGIGYEVELAHSGDEALEKLNKNNFDLIISDILMPRMDGFQLCHEVKVREQFRHIPFVFYTATYTEKRDEELGLALGASRFIIKPIEPETFLAAIREVLREYESGRVNATPPIIEKEEVFFKSYNQRLVQKLEAKVEELDAMTRQMKITLLEKDREVIRRQRVEEELHRLNAELEKRILERTADLAAANEELETFAYATSHDLRAPLRGIDGYTQALLEAYGNKLDSEGRGFLDAVHAGSQRMSRLVEGLFQLSLSARAKLQREKIDLSLLAQEIAAELRRDEPARMADFVVAPEITAEGDPALLRAVLQNLIGNAWKYTSKQPQTRIEFGVTEQEGRCIYFVRDNGAGFDMRHAAKLFEPFQRLHRESDFPGAGIGLATVRRIINRHGGRVWADAAEGKGATFYFTLGTRCNDETKNSHSRG